MRSDHKETGASKKKFKYKRLGPIHVMGKYNLARFKGAALRDIIFFQAQVFFAGFDTKLRLKLSRQPLVLAHPPPPNSISSPLRHSCYRTHHFLQWPNNVIIIITYSY